MFKNWFRKSEPSIADKAHHLETDGPAVIIHIFTTQIDLYPIAEEVTKLAPEPTGMTVMKLATLAQESFNGSYIHVANYPKDVDREFAKLVICRVQQWARWQYRDAQLADRNSNEYLIKVEEDACPRMLEMEGKSCAERGFERLPLNTCWQRCFCDYRWERKRRHGFTRD